MNTDLDGLDGSVREEVEAARKLADESPKRAYFAVRALAKELGDGDARVLAFDFIADVCSTHGSPYAAPAFSAARSTERRLGRKVGSGGALARYREFAARGAVDPR